MDGHIAQEGNDTGFDIDLHHGHTGRIGIGGIGVDPAFVVRHMVDIAHAKIARGLQTRLHIKGVMVESAFVDVLGNVVERHFSVSLPLDANAALFTVQVFGCRFQHTGCDPQHLMVYFPGRVQRSGASHEQAARTPVTQPIGTCLGIALHDPDSAERDAEGICHNLGNAGFIARAGRSDAGQNGDLPARADADGSAFIAADKGVGDAAALGRELKAHAHANIPALGAEALLFLGKAVVAGLVHDILQRLGIITAVQGRPRDLYIGKLVLGHKILEPHRSAVHLDRIGNPVHDAVHEKRGRLLAKPAIRVPGTLVGDHDGQVYLTVRDFVRAGYDKGGHIGHAPTGHRGQGTDVANDTDLEADHGSVRLAGGRELEGLLAGMATGHQMFGAFFDPFDWLAGPLRQQAGQRVFLIGRNLDPKGTTYLGLNHLDVVLIHLQGVGQGRA